MRDLRYYPTLRICVIVTTSLPTRAILNCYHTTSAGSTWSVDNAPRVPSVRSVNPTGRKYHCIFPLLVLDSDWVSNCASLIPGLEFGKHASSVRVLTD